MILDQALIDNLSQQAKENPRLRINFNLHDSLNDKVQRLFNAVELGSKFVIHRHPDCDETEIVLRGHVVVKVFDDKKNIIESYDLNPTQGRFGVHLDKGVWHTVEVLESDTVIFEVKDGPYQPSIPENILE